jgi:hypothetical protein
MNFAAKSSACALVAGLFLSSLSAQTVHETASNSSLTSGHWNTNTQINAISSSDLLEAGSITFSSLTANNPANTSIPGIATMNSGLNDGLSIGNSADYAASAYYAYNYTHGAVTAKGSLIVGSELAGGEVLTFDLNTAHSPYGYDINSVNTIAGWTDHASVSNQNYTLAYSLVSAPGTFITLTSVAYNPNDPTADNPGGGGVATEVSLTNVDLSHVADLRFTFTPDPTSLGGGPSGTGLWLQEIDSFGSPTATPEPGTWALLILSLGGLAFFRYRGTCAS